MDEKQKIIEIIKKFPKHYSKMITSDSVLYEWVKTNSLISDNHIPSQIYSAINSVDNICKNSKQKKFTNINDGFSFCGKSNTCQCAKESVSTKVKQSKNSRDIEQIQKENEKRKNTNIVRYGVENTGLLEHAKTKHKEFYSNKNLVNDMLENSKNVLQSRYNVSNPRNINGINEKIKNTNIVKYGVTNPMQNIDIASKSALQRKLNYDPHKIFETNFIKFKKMLLNEFHVEPNITANEYKGVAERPAINFKCIICNFSFTKRFDYKVPPICKVCHPTEITFQSKEEIEVLEFIKSIYKGNIVHGDRTAINPYQLDIYLPELNIAFEYNGLYWHSEISGKKTWNYHATKRDIAFNKGIRLITIFSDEWNKNKVLVKEKIRNILNLSSSKIGARKCVVDIVHRDLAKSFHDQYHIQGSPTKLGINVGLFSDGRLIGVGSFVKKSNSYELVRFSTSMQIQGGASKILNYFISKFNCNSIVSFADLRWSNGDMYIKLGFVEVSRVPPMQTYVKNYADRYHKLFFSKKKINPENKNKTEWEIMRSMGYDRIWDCGKIKFQLTINRNKNGR